MTEALAHPYFAKLHDEKKEPVAEQPLDTDFDADSQLTLDEIRERLVAEIAYYSSGSLAHNTAESPGKL